MVITWGNATITLNRPVFEHGFQCGRNYYYWEQSGERHLSDEELLTVIAIKDKEGHFHLDFETLEHPEDGAEEMLGTLIGYLSAPLYPETAEERAERFSCIHEVVSVS